MDMDNCKYGPDSSEEELNAIRQRVRVLKEGVILYRELPFHSSFTVELMMSWVDHLAAEWDSYAVVVDLSEASHPSAEERDTLRRVLGSFSRMNHMAIMTGQNVLLNVGAKFIMSGIEGTKVTVHSTMEVALRELWFEEA